MPTGVFGELVENKLTAGELILGAIDHQYK